MGTSNDEGNAEDLLEIDDQSVPETVRVHGMRFRNPARFVVALGNDEYVPYAEDGELLDMLILR